MKKISKVSAISAASFLIAGTTAFTAFAAMPAGTVVIGNKAYSLKYANDPSHQDEITAAVVAANNKVYVKEFDNTTWVNNDAAVTQITDVAGTIPAVAYTDGTSTTPVNYKAGDGDVDNGTTVTPTSNGTANVSVSMMSNTSVAQGQALIPVGTITITGTTGTSEVTGVQLSRAGLSKDQAISSLTVWDGATKVSMSGTLSDNKADVTFLNPIEVSAGQTKTLQVKANLTSSQSDAPSGAQMTLTLTGIDTAEGTTLTGFAPASSGTLTVVEMSGNLGYLKVDHAGDAPTGTVDAGSKNTSVAKFLLEPQQEDQDLNSITFTQNGSVSQGDLTNFQLYIGGTCVASKPTSVTANKVTFAFDAPGYKMAKGSNYTVDLRADIISGTDKTIDFTIDDENDVQATGTTYNTAIVAKNYNYQPGTATQSELNGNFNTLHNSDTNTLTINKGKFIISKDDTSVAASTIGDTFKEQNFASISVQALGEPMQIQKLYIAVKGSGAIDAKTPATQNDGTYNLKNLKIVANGKTVYSDSNKFSSDSGITDTTNGYEVSLTNPPTVNPGQPVVFTIYADTDNSFTSLGGYKPTYQIGICNAYGVGTQSGKTYHPSGTDAPSFAVGNIMTVGSVYAEAIEAPQGDVKSFAGSSSINVVSYNLDQNLSEDVSVSKLVVKAQKQSGSSLVDGDLYNYIRNVKLVDANGNTLSNVITTPTSDTYEFTFSNPVTLKAHSNQKVNVVADILSTPAVTPAVYGNKYEFSIVGNGGVNNSGTSQASTIANGNTITFNTNNSNKSTFAVYTGGVNLTAQFSLKVNLDDNNVSKNAKDVVVGAYRLNNRGNDSHNEQLAPEAVKVTKIRLSQYKDPNGAIESSDPLALAVNEGMDPKGASQALHSDQFSNIRIVNAFDHSKVYGSIPSLGSPQLVTLDTPIVIGDDSDIDIAILADINGADADRYLGINIGDPDIKAAHPSDTPDTNYNVIEAQGVSSGTSANIVYVNNDYNGTDGAGHWVANNPSLKSEGATGYSTDFDSTNGYTVVTPGGIGTNGIGRSSAVQVTVPTNITVSCDSVNLTPKSHAIYDGTNEYDVALDGAVVAQFTLKNNGDGQDLKQVQIIDTGSSSHSASPYVKYQLVKTDDGTKISAPFSLDSVTRGAIVQLYDDYANNPSGKQYKSIDSNGTLGIQVVLCNNDDDEVNASTKNFTAISSHAITAGDGLAFRIKKDYTRYFELGKTPGVDPTYHIDSDATFQTVSITTP